MQSEHSTLANILHFALTYSWQMRDNYSIIVLTQRNVISTIAYNICMFYNKLISIKSKLPPTQK